MQVCFGCQKKPNTVILDNHSSMIFVGIISQVKNRNQLISKQFLALLFNLKVFL